MRQFKPTYLYIKQHALTGKLYFGKTTKDPLTYYGSGTRWRSHINYHGKEHVVTLWCELFEDIFELVAFAISFSSKIDVVGSSSWLNLIGENGIDGNIKGNTPWNKGKTNIYSDSVRKKISDSRKGKPTTKGKPSPHSALNGKKGAAKLSATIKGRHREYREDGSWFWVNPTTSVSKQVGTISDC